MTRRFRPDDERGVIAVMFALLLVVMLGILALVIDLGNARQERRAAQASADAAVLAGGEAIESGMNQSTGSIPWSTVVTQVKNYAKANENISFNAWTGCNDPNALTYLPDSGSANGCISATTDTFPAPSSASIGQNVIYLRVLLPQTRVKTYFAKALGNGDLVVGASSTAKIVFTVTANTTVEHIVGGPCALCILNPDGLTLDGQNGDVAITGGNVIVNSTASTAASLNPNGHVKITTDGGAIGGPGAPANFSGAGYDPAPTTLGSVTDPLMDLPQCGDGSPSSSIDYCPTNPGSNGTKKGATLAPGIYSSISNSHTLNPGIYVVTGGITLSGNDLIQGDGVMLYFACSNYPAPCASGEAGAGITATGNGAMRITGITEAQCTADGGSSLCPYVGMMSFADRNNTATQTWRGNGTNENGQDSGLSGTIYMKSGTMDLRGNGYQMASQIVTGNFTMKGNPSTVTISYDQSKNYNESHDETHITYTGTPDNNGLSG